MMSREKRIRLMGDAMEALLDTMSFRKGDRAAEESSRLGGRGFGERLF